jgi:hypothetical protein
MTRRRVSGSATINTPGELDALVGADGTVEDGSLVDVGDSAVDEPIAVADASAASGSVG